MAEYMHLVGAEEVSRAGHNMSSAAEQMQRAANNIEYAMLQQQRFMDDWLMRLELLLQATGQEA